MDMQAKPNEESHVAKKPKIEDAPSEGLKKKKKAGGFKVGLFNIPKFATAAEVKKLVKKYDLEPVKVIRPGGKKTFAYVIFRDEETQCAAIKRMNGIIWKKQRLRVDKPVVTHSSVREKNAPLYKMQYEEQLVHKKTCIQDVLDNYCSSVKNVWLKKFPEADYNFKVSEIKPSSVLEGYRNKCTFLIGTNRDMANKKCIGFGNGATGAGNISIEEPFECTDTCSELMFEEVRKFSGYLETSPEPVYDSQSNVGVWKALEMRTNNDNAIMITPIVDMRPLDPTRLAALKSNLINFYTDRTNCSLFLKLVGGKEQTFHLSGPEYFTEKLCGFEFQITSESFFHINTAAAATLYETVCGTASLDKDTHLLDLCCGTGTIGIILSPHVKHVYGIELVASAVEDAKRNAKRNNVENISFYAGNAKTATSPVIRRIPKDSRIVAIVDPPRNGLHQDVISTLRGNAEIKEVVYVSCDIKQITDNIVSLCGPTSSKYMGDPFKFVNCVAVDLFPHTNRFEVVFHFKR